MFKTVSYCRVSTAEQASEEKVSIPDQIAWAKDISENRGWTYEGEYTDIDVRGDVEMENRKGFIQLLKDARQNKFDLVLVYHSSRLSREADIGLKACRVLEEMGKQIYIRNSPVEPIAPKDFNRSVNISSKFMAAFAFTSDLSENVARSERARSGAMGLAKRGFLKSAPYGFVKVAVITNEQKVSWKFERDPVKAPVVEHIFSTYAKGGGSLRSLMLQLNRDNVPSPSGKVGLEAWTTATIKNILGNPAYIGLVRYGRKLGSKFIQGKTPTGKGKRVFADPSKWIMTKGENFEGFIDKGLFDMAGEKLKSRKNNGRSIASPGLLTGLVKCAKCGRNAYHKARIIKKKKYGKEYLRHDYVCSSWFRYKNCNRHIMAAQKLHDAVISEIEKVATDKKYQDSLFKKAFPKNGNSETKVEQQEKALRDIKLKRQRLLEAYEDGAISLDTYKERDRVWERPQLEAEEKLKEIKDLSLQTKQAKHIQEKFVRYVTEFHKELDTEDFEKRKELLRRVIQRVTVGDGQVLIDFAI